MDFESAISQVPKEIRDDLLEVAKDGGRVPADKVAEWLGLLDADVSELMIMLLPFAASYARIPVSGFRVGAVALGMPPSPPARGPGGLYLGSNMEFSRQALSFGIHGEQSATNNAWLHGETGLQALAINAAPCGYCRQFLHEISTADGLNILRKANADPADYSYTSRPLTDYLPDPFGPGDLGFAGGLMKPESHGLMISGGDSVAQAALAAADRSYSPYTHDFSGVALATSSGEIYAGRYAENAAYNPSLSPLESALAFMNMALGPQTAFDIAEAVLVEAQTRLEARGGSGRVPISQASATAAVLSSVAPEVPLQCFSASLQRG